MTIAIHYSVIWNVVCTLKVGQYRSICNCNILQIFPCLRTLLKSVWNVSPFWSPNQASASRFSSKRGKCQISYCNGILKWMLRFNLDRAILTISDSLAPSLKHTPHFYSLLLLIFTAFVCITKITLRGLLYKTQPHNVPLVPHTVVFIYVPGKVILYFHMAISQPVRMSRKTDLSR